MGLPSGTVTFLFTDLEGSTALLREGEEQYANLLDEHRRVLRAAFARHAGAEVDTQGDAFFAVFTRATDAVAAAVEAQRELAVPIRMGIHTGEPLVGDEGYVGMSVHRAARIAQAAHGGQAVISEATRAVLVDEDLDLRDLGDHRLKDLTASQRLFQLGAGDFPPLRTLDVTRTNLPVQPTRFIGRQTELAEVVGLLREEDVRLLTLTGPGGVGKTRLALQAAAEAVEDFPGGAWFVGLAEERQGTGLRARLAAVLGLPSPTALEPYLAERELLLVLDNLEQIDDAGAVVAELLQSAEGVRVLTASREPLRVAAEQEYHVPPLDDHDAVALFTRRARAVDPRFAIDGDRAVVEEICRRVDALPLAIELAAARTKLLRPGPLLERIGQALPLLKTGLADVPQRHRTLSATIAWSYDLLPAEEQEFFQRLAVFSGSFSIDAAAAVTASQLDPLDALADLVDKSLVVPVESPDEPRFRLLQTIAEFGLERLRAVDDEGAAWQRLAGYMARCARELEENRTGASASMQMLRDEENLVAAVRWAREHDRDVFAELVADAWHTIDLALRREEAEAAATLALERIGERDPLRRFKLLTLAATCRANLGDLDGALSVTDESLELLAGLGNPVRLVSRAHNNRGAYLSTRGDLEEAKREFEQAIELSTEAGDSGLAMSARMNLALVVTERDGDFPQAAKLLEEGASEERGALSAWIEINRACILLVLGDVDRAAELARQSYPGLLAAGRQDLRAFCLEVLAVVARRGGHPERAARLMGAARQVLREYGIVAPNWLAYERALFDDARGHVRRELGDTEFDRALDEGAELRRNGRETELLAL